MSSIANQTPIAEGLFTWPSNDPRLLGSRCRDCGVVTFPAQSGCPACCGEDTEQIELARRGTLWTWTIQGFLPNRPPYEGPGDSGNLPAVRRRLRRVAGSGARGGAPARPNDLSPGCASAWTMDLVVEKYIERDGKDIIAFFFQSLRRNLIFRFLIR